MRRIHFGGCTCLVDEEFMLQVCSSLPTMCLYLVFLGCLHSVWSVCVRACVRALCSVCSMITLVFLQVLEPFCPLSEQENSEPEELEVNRPTSSATVFIASQTELNSRPLPSDSSSPTHKDLSCNTFLTETDIVSVPLTAIASPSFSDAESVLPPPLLPNCTSASQPCSVSVSPLFNSPSDTHSGSLSADDDSCVPTQTQSDPPSSHPFIDGIVAPLSNILSDESNCTSHSSSQKVPNSFSDSLA